MILYNSEGNKFNFNCYELLGSGKCGNVYRISDNECIKILNRRLESVDTEVLTTIKGLSLNNFYAIHELFYSSNELLKAYTMEYYQSDNIDIFMMPIDYTLENLVGLYNSVMLLTENNIYIDDLCIWNVIMSNSGITVIDVDLYKFNKYYTKYGLYMKNIAALKNLFKELYFDSIIDKHIDYKSNRTTQLINDMFNFSDSKSLDSICKKLTRYKNPSDYLNSNRY